MTDWKTFLFGLSIGLNIAFFAVWGFFALEDTLDRHGIVQEGKHGKYKGDHHKKKWDGKKKHSAGWWFYHKKLDVTEEQWETIKPRLKEFHRSSYELCKEIGQARNELLALVGREDPDEEAIEAKKQAILDLRRQKQALAVDYFSGKKDVLNSDQRDRFFKMLRHEPRCKKHSRFLDSSPRRYGWDWQRSSH